MKHLILAAVASVAMTGAAFADPIEGMWKTQEDDGAYALVQIVPCGGAYCGTIKRTFNASGEYSSPNIGKQIVQNMKPSGSNKYEGKVWRPSNNKIYVGKIDLAGSTMKLAGCVAGGLICAKQTWSRVK